MSELPWQRVVVPMSIILGFWLLSIIFSRWLLPVLRKYSARPPAKLASQFLAAFAKPIRAFIIILGIYLAWLYLPLASAADLFMSRVFRSAVIIILAWGAHVMSGTESALAEEIRVKFKADTILIPFFSKVVQFVIWAMALVLIAHEWDYDVNGFIAGLGLGGLAFALAAKDALANIFGGIVIIMEKPFSIGDWVETPSVEGTVEGISFRSTRFRSFTQALVTVPNSTLANEPITNYSRMGKRQVKFTLSIDYAGPRDKIEQCIRTIRSMLQAHPDIHPETILVYLDSINVNSLDILVHFYTNTTKSTEYLGVKEDVNYRIMDILAGENISLATPGRTIYSENIPAGKNTGGSSPR
jgi:MscS family membrane protein